VTLKQDLWAPVVAALGAALLTVLGTWGLDALRHRRAAKDSHVEQVTQAYGDVLRWSQSLLLRAQALGQQGRYDSGIIGRLENFIRRDHYTPMRVFEEIRADVEPLQAAASRVWLIGTPEGIDLARKVMAAAEAVLGASTALPERGRLESSFRAVVGEHLTEDQEEAARRAVDQLVAARTSFAQLARRETGRELLTDADRPAEQPLEHRE